MIKFDESVIIRNNMVEGKQWQYMYWNLQGQTLNSFTIPWLMQCYSEVWITVNPEIFANSVKRHICDAKNLQLGHDLSILVNNRVILAFCDDFNFKKFRICEVSQK